MRSAVFLDRDGVINHSQFKMGKLRAPYTLDELTIIAGVHEATKKLKAQGFLLIVVTNQPDVKRGWVSREQVDLVNQRIAEELSELDDIYACFHDSGDNCLCRKPKPGLLLQAAKKWDIDLKTSFMLGDRQSDVEAGLAAGCTSLWIYGDAEDKTPPKNAHGQFSNLLEASAHILS